MPMRWLMTVQEEGIIGPVPPALGWRAALMFDLSSRWMSFEPAVDDEAPPNPNCLADLQRRLDVVEICRPDGTRLSTEMRLVSVHFNFAYEIRSERDAAGRIRNPWRQQLALRDVAVADVPPGSEIWGDVQDEDVHAPEDLPSAP
jgi:hypothetical protein